MPPSLRQFVRIGFVSAALLATGSAGLCAEPPVESKIAPSILDPVNGVGSWISETNAFDKQTCRLWKAFDIPRSTVAKARLCITVDNGYRLFLDGREIGRGSDWRTLNEYDLTWVLTPGHHVFAVEAFN